jgi:hypothetical protein
MYHLNSCALAVKVPALITLAATLGPALFWCISCNRQS